MATTLPKYLQAREEEEEHVDAALWGRESGEGSNGAKTVEELERGWSQSCQRLEGKPELPLAREGRVGEMVAADGGCRVE